MGKVRKLISFICEVFLTWHVSSNCPAMSSNVFLCFLWPFRSFYPEGKDILKSEMTFKPDLVTRWYYITLSDVATPYSKQATPYTIGLWRNPDSKWLPVDIFPRPKLYCVALCDTVHFQPCDQVFLLYPLLAGVATSDSVYMLVHPLEGSITFIAQDPCCAPPPPGRRPRGCGRGRGR